VSVILSILSIHVAFLSEEGNMDRQDRQDEETGRARELV
jgi:hypothetical protein